MSQLLSLYIFDFTRALKVAEVLYTTQAHVILTTSYMFVGSGMRKYLEGNHRAVAILAERYRKYVFSSTVGLVRPRTKDKLLKESHDVRSALIHDVLVCLYCFDCYTTSHYKCGNPTLLLVVSTIAFPNMASMMRLQPLCTYNLAFPVLK